MRSYRFITLLALPVVLAGLASAASVTIDANLYGHLDQNTTSFCLNGFGNSFGCGPTATVNSFLMLDNKYGSNLVPDTDDSGTIDNDELESVASILSGAGYMECQACNGGTTVNNLIAGKRRYLNEQAPGLFYVHSMASPTFQWFFDELTRGQDIEILIGFYNGNTRLGGHYLTVNGISGEDTNNNNFLGSDEATMYFIDPSGGTDGNSGLYEFNDNTLGLLYAVGGTIGGQNVTTTVIEYGIAESPIPEPGTVMFLFSGVAVLAVRRYRRTA